MALSLNDVNKSKSKKKKSKAAPTTAKAQQKKTRRAQKPWQSQPKSQGSKFARSQVKDLPLTEANDSDFSTARVEEGWLYKLIEEKGLTSLLTSEGLNSLKNGLWTELAQRSYWVSRAEQSVRWLNEVQIYPRFRMPVPAFLSQKDED